MIFIYREKERERVIEQENSMPSEWLDDNDDDNNIYIYR